MREGPRPAPVGAGLLREVIGVGVGPVAEGGLRHVESMMDLRGGVGTLHDPIVQWGVRDSGVDIWRGFNDS